MKKIYVGNLPYSASEAELEVYFSECGAVTSCNIVKDRESGRSKGFGFIEFESEEQAEKAVELSGNEFSGRPLKISLAREQQRRGRSHQAENTGNHW